MSACRFVVISVYSVCLNELCVLVVQCVVLRLIVTLVGECSVNLLLGLCQPSSRFVVICVDSVCLNELCVLVVQYAVNPKQGLTVTLAGECNAWGGHLATI